MIQGARHEDSTAVACSGSARLTGEGDPGQPQAVTEEGDPTANVRGDGRRHVSVAQYGTAGSHRRGGVAVWSGSQIGIRYHHPPPSSTGRLLGRATAPVRHEERLGWRPSCAPEVLPAEAHRRDLATTGPPGQRGAAPAVSVEPGGRRHTRWASGVRRTMKNPSVTQNACCAGASG
jgi:hypothetical protein